MRPDLGLITRSHSLVLRIAWLAPVLAVLVLLPPTVAGQGFPGVSLRIADETVPPGGMLQLKVEVTEPKPILKGRQGMRFSNAQLGGAVVLGPVQGVALFSLDGDASGVAVLSDGGARFFFSSPLFSFGTGLDFPVITMALPVDPNAVPGQAMSLTLDQIDSEWLDPAGQPYLVELTPGLMTVGGAISVSDVSPGAGMVPAGAPISIKGVGFQADAEVDINGALVATSQLISSNEIRVTLNRSVNMEHRRVRVTDKSSNERVEYYSSQRTAAVGKSKQPLIAASFPLFSHARWTTAYLKPVLNGTVFTGLAVQNLRATAVRVRLELYSSQGDLLTARSLSLAANSWVARDLAEFFPGFAADTGTTVKLRARAPVQALGLLADDASGEVLPVELSATP